MAIEKEQLNDFLPDGFETLNQPDYKSAYTAEKVRIGYEKDVPDLVAGDNLNYLIDNIGKNFHKVSNFFNYMKDMPINNVPTINEFNQLDYMEVDVGNKVDKTGDTMTGTLNIENTTIEAQAPTMIRFQNTALPQIAPSADYYSKQRGAIKFFSSDDILTNAVSSYISASGENALALDSNTLLPNGTTATGYVRIYSNSKGEVHTECCDTTTNLQSIVNRKFLQNSGGFATYSKAENGYYKFINGLIIQWGSFAGNSSTVTVTFPTAFTANPTFVCARPLTSTKIADDSGGASSLSKTNCKFFAWNGWQYKWIAIGY